MHGTRPAYNKDKFRELIVYIAKQSEDDERFGATKLNKLMFYADFQAYGQLGQSITGARYHKIQNGPAAAALVPARDELIDAGELEMKSEHLSDQYRPRVRLVANRNPDLSVFSDEERQVIESVIKKYWEMNGTQISNESHKELGVLLAQETEDIPYGTVYLPSDMPSKADVAYAQQRMRERGWAAG